MKIILLHQYFYPEVAGAALRLTELAVGLKQEGLEIEVLTGPANYGRKRKVPRKEMYHGVSIERLPKIPLDKNSLLGRAVGALTYFLAALIKLILSNRDALLLIGTDPPFLPFLGWLMNRVRGQNYVVVVFDIYPDIAVELGRLKKTGLLVRFWNLINSISFSKAKATITLGERMKRVLLDKCLRSNPNALVTVIPTWEDGQWIQPRTKSENWFCQKHGLTNKTVVLYSGNMGLAHDLISVIDAANVLRDHRNLVFLFIGGGPQQQRLVELATRKCLQNVQFLPYQPLEVTPYSLSSADIAVVSMKPGTEGLCLPSKLQTALASGAAILGIVPEESEVADVIAEHDCGIQVHPEKPDEIAEAILKLHENEDLLSALRRNARRCFESCFTKELALQKYVKVLRQIDPRVTGQLPLDQTSEKGTKQVLIGRE